MLSCNYIHCERRDLMSIFSVKLIAMVTMLIDHIGAVFGKGHWALLPFDSYYLRWIGRIAFPIFAFCIVNGWQHSRNKKKYFINLCLCAIFSQFAFTFAFYTPNLMPVSNFDTPNAFRIISPVCILLTAIVLLTYWYFVLEKKADSSLLILGTACMLPSVFCRLGYMTILADDLNVLYTLALGLVLIAVIENLIASKYKFWEKLCLVLTVVLAILVYGANADYGKNFAGLLLIVGLYFLRNNRLLQSGYIVLWGYYAHYQIYHNPSYAPAMFIPAILLLLYNNKPGPRNKFAKALFYWFYPAHLMLIGLVNVALRFGFL